MRDSLRLEAGNTPSESTRQAKGRGRRELGSADLRGLSQGWAAAGPRPQTLSECTGSRCQHGDLLLSVGVSPSLCVWGRRESPVYFWEPSGWL